MTAATALVTANTPSAELAEEAVAEALSAKIPQIAGIRASTAYKQPVCNRMVQRILDELLEGTIR